MSRHISKRLRAIAALVPEGGRVADIGCDHAQLLIHLALTHRLRMGIGGDIHPGPLAQAQLNLQAQPISLPISLQLGNGLKVLQNYIVDSIVIAGLGGKKIVAMLEEGSHFLRGVHTLVLQPNNGSAMVRYWLANHQWCLVEEDLVEERDYLYEIMVARPGWGDLPYRSHVIARSFLRTFGPLLWKKRHPLLAKRWQREWERCGRVLASLQNPSHPHTQHWWYWRDILREGNKILHQRCRTHSEYQPLLPLSQRIQTPF